MQRNAQELVNFKKILTVLIDGIRFPACFLRFFGKADSEQRRLDICYSQHLSSSLLTILKMLGNQLILIVVSLLQTSVPFQ